MVTAGSTSNMRDIHLSHIRRVRLVVRRYSLIEVFVGYNLDLGDFNWEVVWRYIAAHSPESSVKWSY